MKEKIKSALEQGYKNLGLGEAAFERVAALGETFIKSEEDIAAFVKNAEAILKAEQSAADKVRTELNVKIKALEGDKAELEAKLKGSKDPAKKDPDPATGDPAGANEPPKKNPSDEVPAWAQALIDSNKSLSDEIATMKAERSAKTALTNAEATFKNNDYVKKYSDEATDAWERAIEMYDATGKTWTAEQLQEKAMGYFNKSVSKKGVDITKPFDGEGAGKGKPDFKDEVELLKSAGVEMPE